MSTPHSEKYLEHIRKAGIRKGFFSEEQFSEALEASQSHPQLSFLKFLELTGIVTDSEIKELELFLQSYEKMLATLPLLPEDPFTESEALLLAPIEDNEEEMEIMEAPTSSSLNSIKPGPERETRAIQRAVWEATGNETNHALLLLPEPESLPSFSDLVQQTASIPFDKKFQFEQEEDKSFADYVTEKNLLSRETIEVLLEMQKSLKKMCVSFSLAQLAQELNYVEESSILQIQGQLKATNTLLKSYQLSKPESQFVASRPQAFASEEILKEAKKLKDYFLRLGIEKTLAEILLIQGHYQKGDFQKTPRSSRISSVRKSSTISSSKVSSSSRRPSRTVQNMRKKRF